MLHLLILGQQQLGPRLGRRLVLLPPFARIDGTCQHGALAKDISATRRSVAAAARLLFIHKVSRPRPSSVLFTLGRTSLHTGARPAHAGERLAQRASTMAFLSTTNAPGTRAYTSVVCENNWFEERVRIESGERVYIGCMEGAYLRPEDPDLSIAPDYRNPEVPADGRLVMPHRSWRSRTTFDSSRQGADDGFRIYSSLSGDDYCPIEKRGNSQLDDLRKTRSATTAPMATTARIANREKNAMFEQSRICDGGR